MQLPCSNGHSQHLFACTPGQRTDGGYQTGFGMRIKASGTQPLVTLVSWRRRMPVCQLSTARAWKRKAVNKFGSLSLASSDHRALSFSANLGTTWYRSPTMP